MAEMRKRNRYIVVVPDLPNRWENVEYEPLPRQRTMPVLTISLLLWNLHLFSILTWLPS